MSRHDAIAAKINSKNIYQKNGLRTINLVKITKQSPTKFLGLFSCKGHTSGSNITKKIIWWNYLCNDSKMIRKDNVPRNCFAIISARMVCYLLLQHNM